MNSKFKKIITSIILIVMLLNITASQCLAATSEDSVWDAIGNGAFKAVDGVVGIVTTKARVLLVIITAALQGITSVLGHSDDGGISNVVSGKNGDAMITVEEIFFNDLNITKINFFDMDKNSAGEISSEFRTNVAIWYYALRNLAIIILLCILIYVGIRMAISTVASEKAMYKNMFKDWVVSFILVFFMHYIIVVSIQANNSLVEIMRPKGSASLSSDYMNTLFINAIGVNTENVIEISAVKSWASALIYAMMVFFTLAFLWTYVKRMITLAFLIIISPLVTVTYAIDKMGDGKSQALNTWLKEFVYNILLQPFQCVIYLAIMKTTIQKLAESEASIGRAALAIMCMMFVFSAEKIIRRIFGFDKASSIADTMATTGAMLATMSNLKKLGPKGKSGSTGSASGAKGSNAYKNSSKLADKNIEKMRQAATNPVSKMADKVGSFAPIQKATNAIHNSAPVQGASNIAEKVSDWSKGISDSVKQGVDNLATSNKTGERIVGNAAKAMGNKASELGNNVKKDITGAVGSIKDGVKNINTTAGATQAAMTMMGIAAGLTTGNAANAVTYGMAGNEIGAKMGEPARERYRDKQEQKLAEDYKGIAKTMNKLDKDNKKYDLSTEEGKENMKEKCKEVTNKGTAKINKEFENNYKNYENYVKNDIKANNPNITSDKAINTMARNEMKNIYKEALSGDTDKINARIDNLKSEGKVDAAESLRSFAMSAKEKELSDALNRMMGVESALGDAEPEKTVVMGENSTIDRINDGIE